MKEYNVISFSGGKDSTAMLLMMVELEERIDDIVFLDLGFEYPEIYDNVHKVEKYICRHITRLNLKEEFLRRMCSELHTDKQGKLRCGFGWPTMRSRFCTTIKRKMLMKYLKSFPDVVRVVHYIGFAADEEYRAKRVSFKHIRKRFPLIEAGMTEATCLEYCQSKGFDFGGLYKKVKRASCYLCPLSDITSLRNVWKNYPDQWNEMRKIDSIVWNSFQPDYKLRDLEIRFEMQEDPQWADESKQENFVNRRCRRVRHSRAFYEELKRRIQADSGSCGLVGS